MFHLAHYIYTKIQILVILIFPLKVILASTLLWSEGVRVKREMLCQIRVMTFSIKKRINTELFILKTEALYIGDTQIRAMTHEGDQLIVQTSIPCTEMLSWSKIVRE